MYNRTRTMHTEHGLDRAQEASCQTVCATNENMKQGLVLAQVRLGVAVDLSSVGGGGVGETPYVL